MVRWRRVLPRVRGSVTLFSSCALFCLQPVITLDGSISYTFPNEGMHTITVQVAAANTILQDTKTIAVKGQCLCPGALNHC